LPIPVILEVHHIEAVLALTWVAMFAASGIVVLAVSYANTAYSRDHAGFIAGVGAGSWNAVVALTMPWFGRLFDLEYYGLAVPNRSSISCGRHRWMGSFLAQSNTHKGNVLFDLVPQTCD
jgi:hypothetical protein